MRKTVKPAELARILEKHGFVFDRQAGSHAHYRHPDGRWTTIPMHNKELKLGTLNAILKDTNISRGDI